MVSGPHLWPPDFLEGLTLLANMRMCAQRARPARHPDRARGVQSVNELIVPGGRFYEQSKLAWNLLNKIPGVSCTEPQGALYCFPRLDPEVYPIDDTRSFVIDLLRAKKIPGHPRHRVQLVPLRPLPAGHPARRWRSWRRAIGRIASYLESLRE